MLDNDSESLEGIKRTFATLAGVKLENIKNVFISFDSEKNYAPTLFGDIPYNSKGDMIQSIFFFDGEKWIEIPQR